MGVRAAKALSPSSQQRLRAYGHSPPGSAIRPSIRISQVSAYALARRSPVAYATSFRLEITSKNTRNLRADRTRT
eukprot:3505339-Rhodomonas_salina.1